MQAKSKIRCARRLLLGLLLILALPATASAAAYMKIAEIPGDVTSVGHENWIGLESVAAVSQLAEGATSQDPASGLPTGKRMHKPISITKPIDKATPLLREAHAAGTVFPNATVVAPDPANPSAYLTFELQNVVISSYQTSRGAQPMESISMSYSKITLVPTQSAPGKTSIRNMEAD